MEFDFSPLTGANQNPAGHPPTFIVKWLVGIVIAKREK